MSDRILSFYSRKVELYRRRVKVFKKMKRGAIISSTDREVIKGTKGSAQSRLDEATLLLNCYEEKVYGRKRHLGAEIYEGRISNPDCEAILGNEGGGIPTAEDLAELEGALGFYEESETWELFEEILSAGEEQARGVGSSGYAPV